jgi:hypothetical protein
MIYTLLLPYFRRVEFDATQPLYPGMHVFVNDRWYLVEGAACHDPCNCLDVREDRKF